MVSSGLNMPLLLLLFTSHGLFLFLSSSAASCSQSERRGLRDLIGVALMEVEGGGGCFAV